MSRKTPKDLHEFFLDSSMGNGKPLIETEEEEYKLPNDMTELITLIRRIFNCAITMTKSQYIEGNKSSCISPEVQLWLDILKLTVEDVLDHQEHPTEETKKVVREIEGWAFRNSFGLDMISVAVYIAFRIEPELFKPRFRAWLRQNRPVNLRLIAEIEEPFVAQDEVLVVQI